VNHGTQKLEYRIVGGICYGDHQALARVSLSSYSSASPSLTIPGSTIYAIAGELGLEIYSLSLASNLYEFIILASFSLLTFHSASTTHSSHALLQPYPRTQSSSSKTLTALSPPRGTHPTLTIPNPRTHLWVPTVWECLPVWSWVLALWEWEVARSPWLHFQVC